MFHLAFFLLSSLIFVFIHKKNYESKTYIATQFDFKVSFQQLSIYGPAEIPIFAITLFFCFSFIYYFATYIYTLCAEERTLAINKRRIYLFWPKMIFQTCMRILILITLLAVISPWVQFKPVFNDFNETVIPKKAMDCIGADKAYLYKAHENSIFFFTNFNHFDEIQPKIKFVKNIETCDELKLINYSIEYQRTDYMKELNNADNTLLWNIMLISIMGFMFITLFNDEKEIYETLRPRRYNIENDNIDDTSDTDDTGIEIDMEQEVPEQHTINPTIEEEV